jgi:hypothetical protein
MIICALGIITFIAVGIYPVYKASAALDGEIAAIQDRAEEQKILLPLFQTLLKKGKTYQPQKLQMPVKAKLKREETNRIPTIFRDMAQQSNLVLESAMPDVSSLVSNIGHLKVEVLARGGFFDTREFLLRVLALPYLEQVEQVRMQAINGFDEIELRLKVWLAQE